MNLLPLLGAYSLIAPTGRGAYRLVRLARALLPRSQWQRRFVTPDGLAIDLDLGTYPDCCMAVGLYELGTARLIRRLLKPGMHFVDCGANIGYFTLIAARQVGPAGRVDAYEPDPLNRARLEVNLARNELGDRVRIHPLASHCESRTLNLYHPCSADANHGMATLFPALVPHNQPYTVQSVRLDQHLDHVPDLIKIDVEGAEMDVLKGLTGILRDNTPPRLIVEHNPESAAAAGFAPSAMAHFLLTAQPRYHLFWIGHHLRMIRDVDELNHVRRQGNIFVEPA